MFPYGKIAGKKVQASGHLNLPLTSLCCISTVKQESLADANVSARQQRVHEDP